HAIAWVIPAQAGIQCLPHPRLRCALAPGGWDEPAGSELRRRPVRQQGAGFRQADRDAVRRADATRLAGPEQVLVGKLADALRLARGRRAGSALPRVLRRDRPALPRLRAPLHAVARAAFRAMDPV